jgi:selenocysteine-specific elongation factor
MGGRLIVGMAGHIDHGKSALVTALTGRPMDRLAEERRRGITIDLNFAPLPLANGTIAGLIDVPGHEDFVRTMAAGASGIDLALLVIAANEGWKPQTFEHLAVLAYLGIPAGIPVLTKSDLVTQDAVATLAVQTERELEISPVRFEAPIVMSARTGTGLEELRAAIQTLADTIRPRPADDLFRLPLDRVFSLSGPGTIVTGTTWSGTIGVGDGVTVLPQRLDARVRTIEEHGHSRSRSEPGTRTAVGLAGVSRDGIARGSVLVSRDDPWPVTAALDARLTLSSNAPRPLTARARVRVLLGTTEVMARVVPRSPIAPGTSGDATLALEDALVARGGDRFVIRSFSPVTTIGGGVVLDPDPPRRITRSPVPIEMSESRLLALLARRPSGIARRSLPLLLGVPPGDAEAAAARATGVRGLADRWVSGSLIESTAERALTVTADHHAQHPEARGLPLETLRRSLRADEVIIGAAIGDLTAAGRLHVRDGVAALPGFAPQVPGGEDTLARLVHLIEGAGLTPPTLGELEASSGLRNLAGTARTAAARGVLTAVEPDRYYGGPALSRFTDVLRELGKAGSISPGQVRDRLGLSRKYLIPLLEWADRAGITVRGENGRRLRTAR